eukprot:3368797-Prorocentrum_lima.AAC.1
MCFQAPPRSKVRGLARRQAGIQREADPSLSEHEGEGEVPPLACILPPVQEPSSPDEEQSQWLG